MQATECPKHCCQSGWWLQKVWPHYTSSKRSSLAAHPEKIEFKILRLTFKCMHACEPLYLRELLLKQATVRPLRSNTKNVSQIPHTDLKRCANRASFAYALLNIIGGKDAISNINYHYYYYYYYLYINTELQILWLYLLWNGCKPDVVVKFFLL